MKCRVSEPLPSRPYALPKDHKSGPLKGRPIISTCNSVVRPLSQYISDLLAPLVEKHVDSHLRSTSHFTEVLCKFSMQSFYTFGSLDVINLYGSINLEDDQDCSMPGLFTTVSNFFDLHKESSKAPNLTKPDFSAILRWCLLGDTYFHRGENRIQVKGIAMGNCAAPNLAIIFMHEIECRLKSLCPSLALWVRYIDDCFFVVRSTADELLTLANSVCKHIQFTLEMPVNNTIPFLDTRVHVNDEGLWSFSLHIKPSHSGTCLPFDAYVPTSRKRSLVWSESLRAIRNSTPEHRESSQSMIVERLISNQYPPDFIRESSVTATFERKAKPEYTSYLKIPFRSDQQKWRIMQAYRRTKLTKNLRLIFTSEKPLSRRFRPKFQAFECPHNCLACATAEKSNCCFLKDVIYKISCGLCSDVYIGQTARTIRSRILEHIKDDNSHVRQHMLAHGVDQLKKFSWRIVGSQRDTTTRLAMESLHIRDNRNIVMNGCEGISLMHFL